MRIDALKRDIVKKIDNEFKTIELDLPYEKPKQIAYCQKNVDVLKRDYMDSHMYLKIRGPAKQINKIKAMLNK